MYLTNLTMELISATGTTSYFDSTNLVQKLHTVAAMVCQSTIIILAHDPT